MWWIALAATAAQARFFTAPGSAAPQRGAPLAPSSRAAAPLLWAGAGARAMPLAEAARAMPPRDAPGSSIATHRAFAVVAAAAFRLSLNRFKLLHRKLRIRAKNVATSLRNDSNCFTRSLDIF